MQAQQLDTVLLSAAGQHGMSGTQDWDGRNNQETKHGYRGNNGRDAWNPTAGTPGHDIRVRLSYAEDRPALVQVSGEGPLTGQRWEVSRDQNCFIDTRGGDGGDGGHGENGQRGGHGERGRDASEHRDAMVGGPGYPGGNGGRGTNGADGGDAGNVYITVGEDDLDTLVAVQWDCKGGKGGASGVHGQPGAGGRGGFGGAPCSWTETHSHTMSDSYGASHTKYYSTHHTRPGAPPGPDGPPGVMPTEPLFGGQCGANGFCQVKVLRKDLTEGIYPSRYKLIVKDFDVVDENEDGINEPGELLLVKNLQVENVGGMPSPKGNILKIRIQPTSWLEPIVSEDLELPREIAPGATVRVPGVLKAQIKNEFSPRELGTALCAQDTVSLVAFFERLQRPLPEFGGGAKVVYQYPLMMSNPRYLDCVAKGDLVRFSWLIRNISTKASGSESKPSRPGGTHLSDPGGVFDLTYANPETPHEVSDLLGMLEPGAEIPVMEDFRVSTSAQAFTTSQMNLSLMLSDPHSGVLRPIMSFDLRIQVSSVYRYNPTARFLIVANAFTPNEAILQTIDFIENGLQMPVDVFNLSLTGSFTDPDTGQSVLSNYLGKSVVVFGNTMTYFQNGTREVWDLLDPWDTCLLAKGGIDFLFSNVSHEDSLRPWANQVVLPAYALRQSDGESDSKDIREIAKKLTVEEDLSSEETYGRIHTFPVKKKLFMKLESSLLRSAQRATKRLDSRLPLRRFLVAPCDVDLNEESTKENSKYGAVAVAEGLPYSAKMLASVLPHDSYSTTLAEFHVAMVVHSLPFSDQCAIFWNLLGLVCSSGVSATIAYRGERLSHILTTSEFVKDYEKHLVVSSKACEAISWSIATQLTSELSHFVRKSPWPDGSTSQSTIISQLPLTSAFLASAPNSLNLTLVEDSTSLPSTLGPILGALFPLGFSQWIGQKVIRLGNRKEKTRAALQRKVDELLKSLCAPDSMKEIRKGVHKSASAAKQELLAIKKAHGEYDRLERIHQLASQQLSALTNTPNASFLDLQDLASIHRSTALSRDEIAERRRFYNEHRQKRESDEAWSKRMLADMVNPKDRSVSDFNGEITGDAVDFEAEKEIASHPHTTYELEKEVLPNDNVDDRGSGNGNPNTDSGYWSPQFPAAPAHQAECGYGSGYGTGYGYDEAGPSEWIPRSPPGSPPWTPPPASPVSPVWGSGWDAGRYAS